MTKSSGNWWNIPSFLSGLGGFFDGKNKANDGPFESVVVAIEASKNFAWQHIPEEVKGGLSEAQESLSKVISCFDCVDVRDKDLKKDASTQNEHQPQTQTQPLKKSVSFGLNRSGSKF